MITGNLLKKSPSLRGGYVNKFTVSFDEPLIAISVDFQVGRVEESPDTINIGINYPDDPYVSEQRSVIACVPTTQTSYWGHLDVDLRKVNIKHRAWCTSWWHGRSDGGYPSELTIDSLMNCDIGVQWINVYGNNRGFNTSLISTTTYTSPYISTNGITSITAIGGGMVPGTTFTIYGIKK